MKRLFGREKAKISKPPHVKDNNTQPVFPGAQSEDSQYLTHQPHNRDRAHSLAHSSSDEHWDLLSSHDGSSPILTPFTPRPASPFGSVAPHKSSSHKDRDRERSALRKKPPNASNPAVAVGILRALDPHLEPNNLPREQLADDNATEYSYKEERKEKKGFWERASGKDRDKDRERPRDREKKDDDGQAEITRMIGYLTATASEDWSLVLEVCERASASESSAKEAAKALRREFKYAEPPAQLSAARLWAIMLRNSSEVFVGQCASRKFLDTVEGVLLSSRTAPVVRERLLEVLGAAAYTYPSKDGRSDKDSFRSLWRRVKSSDKPDEGIPFNTEDAMFNPPTLQNPHPTTPEPLPQAAPPRPPLSSKHKSSRNRVIPPEEDMRRLLQECKVGRGNAALLAEALTYAKPEDLKRKDIIREFYARCRASQELIFAQIPWASAGAERSRQVAAKENASQKRTRPSAELTRVGTNEQLAITPEENLLAELLGANEELMESLRVYDDLERVGIERDTEERSKKETRIDRSRLRYDDVDGPGLLEPPYATAGGASSSRSPSPSPSPSPAPSVMITPVIPSLIHPLPPLPPHTLPNSGNTHPSSNGLQISLQSLAPPPPAPHGPRSPAHSVNRSRTPSPERPSANQSHHLDSLDRDQAALGRALHNLPLEEQESTHHLDGDYAVPVKPSAKALGKRRVDADDSDRAFDPNDLFYEPNDGSHHSDELLENDSEGDHQRPWHQPVQYVYDAAAERLQERLKEGRTAALVTGVH